MPFDKEEIMEEPVETPEEEIVETVDDDQEITEAVQTAITGAETREEKIDEAIRALESLKKSPGLGGLGSEGLSIDDMEPESEYEF